MMATSLLRIIVGIIGSVVCVLLYAGPVMTFKRVIKEASVGEFSCLPYILALFSALTWGWYGSPVVSNGWENLSLFGTCAIGVLFEMSFIVIYIWYAPREKKMFVLLTMVSMILAILCVIVSFSIFAFHTEHVWKLYVGSIGIVTSMMMYSAPLVAVEKVLMTKSVEFMPFYSSLFSLLTSLLWTIYGILGRDPYLTAPNGFGCLTGILQLVVCYIYSRCKDPTKTHDDIEQANLLLGQKGQLAAFGVGTAEQVPEDRRIIADTGASMHAVGDRTLLRCLQLYRRPESESEWVIKLPDDSELPILGIGRMDFEHFSIPDVYLVDGFKKNLISVGQLDRNHDLVSTFGKGKCEIIGHDGMVVGGAILEDDNMYVFRHLEVPESAQM